MPRYALDNDLPSYKLTVETLKRVESLLKEATMPEEAEGAVTVSVRDAIGTETFSSVADMAGPRFQSQVTSVGLEAGQYVGGTYCAVRFAQGRFGNTVAVRCAGEGARDQALRLYNRLLDVLRDSRTNNWLFNQSAGVAVVAGSLTGVAIALAVRLIRIPVPGERLAGMFGVLALVALIAMYMGFASHLKPYTVFDSVRADEKEQLAVRLAHLFIGTLVAMELLLLGWRIFG